MIKRTFYIDHDDWNNVLKKSKPFKASDIIRALLKAWLDGEIKVIWDNGEFKVRVTD